MNETIWKVDVSDEFLTFTQAQKPNDFSKVAQEVPYNDLNGVYCGNRGFESVQFKLHRNIKWRDEYYHSGQYQSSREWREANGFAYAWEPATYYKYNGNLYTTHVNFV